jgi:bromodomain-containing protein 7/9
VNRPVPDPLPLSPAPAALPTSQRYRHWTIARSAPSRRAREKDKDKDKDAKDGDVDEAPADPRPARPPVATDFGAYTTLMHELFTQPETLLSESALFDELVKRDVVGGDVEARAAQAWVLEVIYGGVEGLAYLRSMAEFVSTPVRLPTALPIRAHPI